MSKVDNSGNDTIRTFHSPSPIYGISPGFNIADLSSSSALPVAALTNVSVNTKSAAINLGARSIEVYCAFSDAVTSCTLNFYAVISGVDTLVYTITGVNEDNADDVFVGGFEGVNFNGNPIKVEATTFAGGGSVSVSIKRTS